VDVSRVIQQLEKKYPGKRIIENKNKNGVTTEIVCEVESEKDRSFAIAVIDSSPIHYHKIITEDYRVIKGILAVLKFFKSKEEYKETIVHEGEHITIKPGEIHSNLGKETWVEVTSNPPWSIDDYYNLETLIKKYTARK
jgi:hypothetical protein